MWKNEYKKTRLNNLQPGKWTGIFYIIRKFT
jgi:hypothetical protein